MIKNLFHNLVTLVFAVLISLMAFIFVTTLGFITLIEVIIAKIKGQWKTR